MMPFHSVMYAVFVLLKIVVDAALKVIPASGVLYSPETYLNPHEIFITLYIASLAC